MSMQTSSEYLALALDVRKVTDSLIQLVEEGTVNPQLNALLQQVMTSLEGTGQTSVKSLRERGAFGKYAGVKAISEEFNEGDRKQLIVKLRMVVQPQPSAQRTKSALAAIEFFDRLERRALFRHSSLRAAKRPIMTR
jgi:hypothetical protein